MKKLLTVALLIAHNLVFASGFQINEHNARAMGMGGAFVALANDPSAIFFNPAGLAQLKGSHLLLGATFITPNSSFRGPAPQVTENKMVKQLFYPINLYGTYQLREDIVVGLGINNPYGLGTKWDENWVGRFITIESDLKTFFFSPTISYKIVEGVSVGWGVDFAYSLVTLTRKADLSPFVGEADVKLSGDGTGWGYRFGVLAKLTNQLSFGLSYRSEVKIKYKGTAETIGPEQLQPNLPNGDVETSLTTPQNWTFGLAFKAMPTFTLTADLQLVGWSSYKELRVDFVDPKWPDLTSPRNYFDSWIARLGGEYNFTKDIDLRAGIFYDKNPIRDPYLDPTLPDADRLGFNFGVGYKLTNNVSVDFAYMFLRFYERTVTNSLIYYVGDRPFNGTYNSTAHLFGFNVSYNF